MTGHLKTKLLVASIALFLIILAKTPTIRAETETATLYPTDDSYVSSHWADETHNGLTLDVRSDRIYGLLIHRVYLKFDLTGIECNRISGATLYLYCYSGSPPNDIRVDACQTTDCYKDSTVPWKEVGLTWNNAPSLGDVIATTPVGFRNGGGWYSWNGDAMKNYVKTECATDGIVSIVIKFTVEECPYYCSRSRDFYSKEWHVGRPYLEIPLAPSIESCDSTGTRKDSFNLADTVYANGSGYSASTTYDLYIVGDVATWSDSADIPTPVIAIKVSSDSSGKILPTAVWNKPLALGKYDIVVDVNGNGKYDAGVDALDDNDIKVTAGFLVIPEYPMGTILGLTGCLVALGVFSISKRNRASAN